MATDTIVLASFAAVGLAALCIVAVVALFLKHQARLISALIAKNGQELVALDRSSAPTLIPPRRLPINHEYEGIFPDSEPIPLGLGG